MTEPTYRVAIIGTGGIANTHAAYYQRHPRTQIAAAADIRPAVLAGFCDKHGIAARYVDYHALLEREKPDLVSVCTWTPTHPEITIAAAEAGARGILSEKPMGAHLGDTRRMVAVCEALGVPLAVHHQRRFWKPIVAARGRIAAGAIGTPLTGTWRTVGGMLNNGAHGVDVHRFILGDPEPDWVMAQVERQTNRWERGVIIEDCIAANVRFQNSYELTLEVDVEEQPLPGWYVFGTEGVLKLEGGDTILYGRGEPEVLAGEPGPEPLEELLAWIEGGPEARNAGRVALIAQEIMMAAYESARTRARVPIPLGPEVERSPLYTMVEAGALPCSGERYDIRSLDGLRYQLQREGIPLTGREHLLGDGSWGGAGLAGKSR